MHFMASIALKRNKDKSTKIYIASLCAGAQHGKPCLFLNEYFLRLNPQRTHSGIKNEPSIPIIVENSNSFAWKFFSGVYGYLMKSVSYKNLLELTQSVFKGEESCSEFC
ncbi:hypothetical protein HZS_7647 [Henneguya salminicola]|nr:hypothetical protein HZS_7647 [Henneguya salminicola]